MVLDVFYVSSSFHLVPSCTLCFAEALEVHDFARTQELDDIADVGIVRKAENVVVGHARLLLCCEVLCQVCDGVACDLHGAGRPGCTGGKLREDADRVVDKIGRKARLADLLLREITRKLVDDGTNHLEMPQLLCADVGQQAFELGVGHGIALGKVAQRCAKLPIRASIYQLTIKMAG